MTISKLLRKALPAVAALGFAAAPSGVQADSIGGELLLGFRASGGAGSTKNYVVDLGPVADYLNATTVQHISLTGVNADLSSAAFYGAGWHARSDLFWGVVGANGNFTSVGGEPTGTLYASKVETITGVITTPWQRRFGGSHSTSTTFVESARSGFNFAPAATNAPAIARTMVSTDANSWSSFQPPVSIASFQTWDPTIEARPSQYLDLFKIVPMASGDSPALSTLLGRLVLEDTGDLTFIPVAALGVNSVQFSSATYTGAEDAVGGVLDVTVTRTGDTSGSTSVTVSTTNGTAIAGSDFTALVNEPVIFLPGEASKTVSVTVVNRDGDQGSRSFGLAVGGNTGGTTLGAQATATGTITEAPSTLQLSNSLYVANQEDSTVNVTVTRTDGSAAVTVEINTTNGTAVAGTDFTALTNHVVNIPANVDSVNVPITLSHPAAVQPNKQFSVTISNPGPGAALNVDTSVLSATVRILATDSVAPVIAIKTVNGNANLKTPVTGTVGGSVTIAGTASDNVGLTSVQVSVDGGTTWTNAVFAAGNWTASNVQPAGGLTTILAKATDARGNVKTATATFTYKITSPLTVNIVGAGTVTGTGTSYEVGKAYTFTAKPGANQAFDNWAGAGLTAPATELPKLTFVFSQALAATPVITVTFVANPFLATSGVIGEYNGLAKAHTGTTASNSTNGALTVTVTVGTGAFSGSLKIDGASLPIGGVFNNVGVAKFGAARTTTLSVPRLNKAPYVLNLTMDLAPNGTKRIIGSLKEFFRAVPVAESDVVMDRAAYSATVPVPQGLLNQGVKGFYTVALPARTPATASMSAEVLTTADFAQGDGVGSLSLTKAGVLTFAGTLADGTGVTSTTKLDKNNASFIYAQLYAAKGGSIGGNIAFNTALTDTDVTGTDLFWFRPYQNAQYYPWGWPGGLLTDLVGTKFAVTPGTSVVPLLSAVNPTTGNATLTFTDGLLSAGVEKSTNIAATNVVTNLGTPADASFKLTITAAKGEFSGTFTHTDGTKPAFKGIILDKGANKAGFGYFLTVSPKVIDGTGEAGGVSLLGKAALP